MSETTVARRDIKRIWEQLERLFDWAGTRSTPMAPANLAALRETVTEELNRVIDRAESLEQVPLLREVEIKEDGMRSVVIDMRDGTTRTFQTRVDWLDTAPGLPETAEALIAEAQAEAEMQRMIANQEAAKAKSSVVDAAGYEQRIQEATIRGDHAEADLEDERTLREAQASLLATAAQRAEEADERIKVLEQRVVEATQRAERAELNVKNANSVHETQAQQILAETERANRAEQRLVAAEAERVEWRSRFLAENAVVNDALPALSKLLVERTTSLEATEDAASEARALLSLKKFEKDAKAAAVVKALDDALQMRSDRE